MFNLQGFSAQKAPVADGNVAAALNKIRSLLTKLLHSPETGVLELTSGEATEDITYGMIVALYSFNYTCVRADADDTFPAGFAICLNDTVAAGESGYFRFAGEAEVRMISGLDLDEGDAVNVSATTAGYGTNLVPLGTLRRIGLIVDASEYAPFVRAIMEPCCLVPER